MKTMILFFYSVFFVSLILPQQGQTQTYRQKIEALDVGSDLVPDQKISEKVYSVQSRALSLANRIELKVNTGQMLGGNGFLVTRQIGVGGQFHLNDSWSVGSTYSKVMNQFSSSTEAFYESQKKLPDVDYANSRLEGYVDYNLLYGKMRFTKESNWYFDQYIGAGVAQHSLASGSVIGPMAHLGVVFWLSSLSVRLEMTDYYYKETSMTSTEANHNIQGSLGLGYVF